MPNFTFRRMTHKKRCSVSRCGNKTELIFYRGTDACFSPLFICEDCLKELIMSYADNVGEETAKSVLSDFINKYGEKKSVIRPPVYAEKPEALIRYEEEQARLKAEAEEKENNETESKETVEQESEETVDNDKTTTKKRRTKKEN